MARLTTFSLALLTDRELLDQLGQAVENERRVTARVIVLLQEMELRRVYLALGYSSLFVYCTHVLHLSEHAAYRRIEIARLARRFPIILELIESGAVTLEVLHVLNRHLTAENHRALLERVQHLSRNDVEHIVATLSPREPMPASVALLAKPPSDAAPITPDRYELQCTISSEAYQKLQELQDLMRHTVPDGDLGVLLERAIALLLEHVSRVKKGAVEHPREPVPNDPNSRYIPASLKRAVWARDDGRCAYVGSEGRCNASGHVEVHHVIRVADGGPTELNNLQLRCRAHNQYEADARVGRLYIVKEDDEPRPP